MVGVSARNWVGLRRVIELSAPADADHVLRREDGHYEQVPRMYGRFFRHVSGANAATTPRAGARQRRRQLHLIIHASRLGTLEQRARVRAAAAGERWASEGSFVPAAGFRRLGIETVLDMLLGERWPELDPGLPALVDLRQTAFERAGAAVLPWTPGALVPRWRSRELERRFAAIADDLDAEDDCIAGWAAATPEPALARQEAFSLLWSGRIGVARTLGWALLELAEDRPALERAQSAIDAGDGQPMLEAIVRETLRLHPPLPRILRVAEKGATTPGGDQLRAGASVSVEVSKLQRDPERHRDPDRFAPERFLDGVADRSSFIAFGLGSRICPGRALAMTEMQAVLGELLRRLRPAPVPRAVLRSDELPAIGIGVEPREIPAHRTGVPA